MNEHEKKRPFILSFIAITWGVSGLYGFIMGSGLLLLLVVPPPDFPNRPPVAVSIILIISILAMSLLCVRIAWGLWRLHEWARAWTIRIIALGAAVTCLYAIVPEFKDSVTISHFLTALFWAVVNITYLRRPHIKDLFEYH
jgi:hypothetical protein